MDAMIFAAGLGTRLRPLTDTIPKALIEVGGVAMLERVATRLIAAGATRIVVNAHHHSERVREFVAARRGFGVETVISDESEQLLDTGGGLAKAAPFFRRDAPFLLHNADVYSDIDLRGLYRSQAGTGNLATLAVMKRDASRALVFDRQGTLCGYANRATGFERRVREPEGEVDYLGFTGVHAIDPRIFDLIVERGPFSIIDLYMRLIEAGERIAAYRVDDATWIDIGKPDQLERAGQLALSDSLR
jgi:NDP-sugar pyrophosphorylase family protein